MASQPSFPSTFRTTSAGSSSTSTKPPQDALKKSKSSIPPDMFRRLSFKRPIRLRIESEKHSDLEVTEVGSRETIFTLSQKGSRANGTISLFDPNQQLIYKLKTFAFRVPFHLQITDGRTKQVVATLIKRTSGDGVDVGNGVNKKEFFMKIEVHKKGFEMVDVRSGVVVAFGHRLLSRTGFELQVEPGHNTALLVMLTLSLQQLYVDGEHKESSACGLLSRLFSR